MFVFKLLQVCKRGPSDCIVYLRKIAKVRSLPLAQSHDYPSASEVASNDKWVKNVGDVFCWSCYLHSIYWYRKWLWCISGTTYLWTHTLQLRKVLESCFRQEGIYIHNAHALGQQDDRWQAQFPHCLDSRCEHGRSRHRWNGAMSYHPQSGIPTQNRPNVWNLEY